MNNLINCIKADITTLKIDVIVNAANTSLLGGGGVDGAIHRAAGPELLNECKTLGGCNTGEAKLTKAYNLPCKYVIHTPGPIWQGGNKNESKLLSDSYFNSLKIAKEIKAANIAFPSISTGVYGFPKKKACEIAVDTVLKFLEEEDKKMEVIFVCFSDEDLAIYSEIIKEKVT